MSSLKGRISAAGSRLSTRRGSKTRFSIRRGKKAAAAESDAEDTRNISDIYDSGGESDTIPLGIFGDGAAATQTIIKILMDKASNLTAKDNNGLSDPFAEVRVANLAKARTKTIKKTLSPHWREELTLVCDKSFTELKKERAVMDITLYDWDRFGKNDFMGAAHIDLSRFRKGQSQSMSASLIHDIDGPQSNKNLLNMTVGTVHFTVTITETIADDIVPNAALGGSRVEKKKGGGYFRIFDNFSPKSNPRRQSRASSMVDANQSFGRARQLLVVDVVAAREIPAVSKDDTLNPLVKLRVGKQNQKTKVGRRRASATQTREWKESFEFLVKNRNEPVELTLLNKGLFANTFLGTVQVDLREVAQDHTTNAWYPLLPDKRGQGGGGEMHLLLTLTDLEADTKLSHDVKDKFCGVVRIHIARARNLIAKDMGGNSDPYCIVRLANSKQRTVTKQRTLSPEWNKTIEMGVKDIFDCVHIIVYDEDSRGRDEFLGGLVIPLLEIENNRLAWFKLKDEDRTKLGVGEIQLRLHMDYSLSKGMKRIINRREVNVMTTKGKFELRLLNRNRLRLSKLANYMSTKARQLNDLFNWEYEDDFMWPVVCVFVALCVFLRIWHMPFLIMFVLLYENPNTAAYMNRAGPTASMASLTAEDEELEDEDDSDIEDEPSSNAKSRGLYSKYKEVTRAGYRAQSGMGAVASFAERVKNTFNWSVPLATWAVCGVCFCTGVAMYLIPFNYLVLLGGLRKLGKSFMLKKGFLKRPKYYKPYNPLFAALGRIPSDIDRAERLNVIVEEEDE